MDNSKGVIWSENNSPQRNELPQLPIFNSVVLACSLTGHYTAIVLCVEARD